MISHNVHSLSCWFILLTASSVTTITTATAHKPAMQPIQSVYQKKPVPMEKLISQIRKSHGDIVIQSARLLTLDKKLNTVIEFIDPSGEWNKAIYDATTGKLINHSLMKDLLPIEKIVRKVLEKHKNGVIKYSRRAIYKGLQTLEVELTDTRNKRWQITADGHTGMIIKEYMYDLKPSGKQLSLTDIIDNARKIEKNFVVLKTRHTSFQQQYSRELIIQDTFHTRRKMTFNAQSGELLYNKPISGYYY